MAECHHERYGIQNSNKPAGDEERCDAPILINLLGFDARYWHTFNMPKRSRTGKPDINQMASNMIDAIAGELPAEQPESEKNPNAVALGRLGGLKGGKARADKLSPTKRRAIAKKAARVRWKGTPN